MSAQVLVLFVRYALWLVATLRLLPLSSVYMVMARISSISSCTSAVAATDQKWRIDAVISSPAVDPVSYDPGVIKSASLYPIRPKINWHRQLIKNTA